MMIDPITLATFMAASIALYLTPGADMMYISASGASGGPGAGLAAGLGVSFGSLFHTVLAVAGVATLIAASPLAFDVLRYAGAAYLVYLAIITWRAEPPESGTGTRDAWRAFRRGALTNILNPKVSVFVLAFLPQFVDPETGPVWIQIAILGTIFSLAAIPFNCSYGLLGAVFSAPLRRSGCLLNRISSLVFGGLAAKLVVN